MEKKISETTLDELKRQAEMCREREVRQDDGRVATEKLTGGQAIIFVVAGPTAGRT